MPLVRAHGGGKEWPGKLRCGSKARLSHECRMAFSLQQWRDPLHRTGTDQQLHCDAPVRGCQQRCRAVASAHRLQTSAPQQRRRRMMTLPVDRRPLQVLQLEVATCVSPLPS
eukprot:TRINITY_DN2920_c0_g2_i1.p2 TRINITY_DN2920_c0_g2~~TRINITY_DN2920_c0_g2_i1.p2  ORF type:complete len:112 (+),score=21.69 TRINITY_DN2920_c0_g2_i1:475-810(+)